MCGTRRSIAKLPPFANWSRRFRMKRKLACGPISFREGWQEAIMSWRAGCFANCSARIFIKPRRALNFPMRQHGKPFLSGANSLSGLCFNLSHSANLVVYAIARERNLGIDVEHVRHDSAGDDIALRYFSALEVNDLKTLPPGKKVEGFFNCWTRKEAYLKATGMGLRIALDSFAVTLSPLQPVEFLSGVEAKWHLAAHRPAESYAAAVVYDGAPCAIRYFSADNMARQETKIS